MALSDADRLHQIGAAIALAIGIGLQNFPEGTAVALPIRREGASRLRALWWGQLSAIVEPIAGVVGAGLVLLMTPILPYAMSFAAGAMIYVVTEELIPESQGRRPRRPGDDGRDRRVRGDDDARRGARASEDHLRAQGGVAREG